MSAMSCMKCGREIPLGQAFCKDCLEDMSHYPVKPDTPVQIPVHPPMVYSNRRNIRSRKNKTPEVKLLRLQKIIRIQAIVILWLLTTLIIIGMFAYDQLYNKQQTFRPGENYVTTEVSQEVETLIP